MARVPAAVENPTVAFRNYVIVSNLLKVEAAFVATIRFISVMFFGSCPSFDLE